MLRRGDKVIVTNPNLKTYGHVRRAVGKNASKIFVEFKDHHIVIKGTDYTVSFDRFHVDLNRTLELRKAAMVPWKKNIDDYRKFSKCPSLELWQKFPCEMLQH